VIVAPVPRRIEIARPDAQPIATGGRFLDPVPPGSDRKTLCHQRGTQIAVGNPAGGQQAAILIDSFGAAIRRTRSKQLRHAVSRRSATAPGSTIGMGAVLRQFRCVKAQQPEAVFAQAQTVTVAGAAEAGNGRRRLIKGRGNQGRGGKHPDSQERSAAATKETVAMEESTQDFTTR